MLLALALISSAADCPTTAIRSPWPGYGTMVHTSSGLELVFADEAGTAIQTLDDAGRLVGEPRRLQYGPALRDVAAAGDLLVFSGPDQPVIAVDATTGARRFEVQLPDEPGLSTPTVLVAAGDGELGVAWERWLQRPDRGAGYLYGVIWFARLSLDGEWLSEPIELPGVREGWGANLGYNTPSAALIPWEGGYRVAWAQWAFADPSALGATMATDIDRRGVRSTWLAEQRADTFSQASGRGVQALAWTTVTQNHVAVSAWIERRGSSSVIELAPDGGSPHLALDGGDVVVAWDRVRPQGTDVVLTRLDGRSGERTDLELPIEPVLGGWQASTGIEVTACGVLVPYFAVGSPDAHAVWFQPSPR